jgi:hypothetical protein
MYSTKQKAAAEGWSGTDVGMLGICSKMLQDLKLVCHAYTVHTPKPGTLLRPCTCSDAPECCFFSHEHSLLPHTVLGPNTQ